MPEDFVMQLLEVQVTLKLALIESIRPDNPLIDTESGWGPNPTAVIAYEVRLRSLRGAVMATRSQPNSPKACPVARS